MQPLLSNDKTLSFKKTNKNFTQQLTSKMETVVTEIFINSQKGLLKRIFLESKTLELLHLQLSFQSKKVYNSDNILKLCSTVITFGEYNWKSRLLRISYSDPSVSNER